MGIKQLLSGIFFALVMVCGYASPGPDANGILYVNKSVAGGDGSGNSWANAIPELGDALELSKTINAATPGTVKEIWVARGTYKPMYKAGNGAQDRDRAFVLLKDVKLYGGFAGNESSLGGRDTTKLHTDNLTTLSGDFNGNDAGFANNWENAYRVVISAGDVGTAMLNGFTVSGGNGNGASSITVNGSLLYGLRGSGMYNSSSSPVITHTVFAGNSGIIGGGMYNSASSPVITHTVFAGNSASTGGCMYNSSSSPVITHVIFTGNSATNGGMYNESSSPVITHTVFAGNSVNGGQGFGSMTNYSSSLVITHTVFTGNRVAIHNISSNSLSIVNSIIYGNNSGISSFDLSSPVIISYSIVQGGTAGTGNLDADPLFVNSSDPDGADNIFGTADDGLRVQAGSPAINAGDPQTNNSGYSVQAGNTDFAGNIRIQKSRVDMGAYESPYASLPVLTTQAATAITSSSAMLGGSVSDNGGETLSERGIVWSLTAVPGIGATGSAKVVIPGTDVGDFSGTVNGLPPGRLIYVRAYAINSADTAYGNEQTFTTQGPDANGILYVNKSVAGGDGSGNSWANAVPELGDALETAKTINAATPGTVEEIWVARGTYKPTYKAGNGTEDRDRAFVLLKDVKLYGGFAGNESSLSVRDTTKLHTDNLTTLSGDFNGDDAGFDNNGENANHVVISSGDAGTGVFDGFTVSGGNASGSNSIILNGNSISRNRGGGLHIAGGNLPVSHAVFSGNKADLGGGVYNTGNGRISYVIFSGNSIVAFGGGLYNINSTSIVTDVVFTGNTASNASGAGMCSFGGEVFVSNAVFTGNSAGGGGAIYNLGGAHRVSNAVFSNNSASGNGGAIFSFSNATLQVNNCTFYQNNAATGGGGGIVTATNSTSSIANSIFWGNMRYGSTAGTGTDIHNISSSTNLRYSISQGYDGDAANGNLVNTDPLFADAAGGDFRLQAGSPAINAGDPQTNNDGYAVQAGNTDLAGNTRIQKGRVDMGAYESPYASLPVLTTRAAAAITASSAMLGGSVSDNGGETLSERGIVLSLTAAPAIGVAGSSRVIIAGTGIGDFSTTANGLPSGRLIYVRAYAINSAGTAYGNQQTFATPGPDANGILYVNKSVTGGDGGGGSWANAMPELGDALELAKTINPPTAGKVKEIWVAKGTYKPIYKAGNGTQDRDRAFVLLKDVKLYGGFAGNELSLSARDTTKTDNLTTLSGDFNGDDAGFANNGENAYHVVISAGNVGTAMLNGFTVSGGNANNSFYGITVNSRFLVASLGGGMYNESSNPVITHVVFSGNVADFAGGGMYNYSGRPVITHTVFTGNTGNSGGGMYNESSNPVITHTVFTGNTGNSGGGMYNESSNPVITHIVFTGNTGTSGGGGMRNSNSSPVIANSIIYGNGSGISSSGGSPVVSYSIVQGGFAGTGNLDTDPLFLNGSDPDGADNIFGTADDGLRLQSGSPAINAGDPQTNNAGYSVQAGNTDITGNTRIYDGRVDIGAYERQMKQQQIAIGGLVNDTIVAAYGDADFVPAASSNFAGTIFSYAIPPGHAVAEIVNGQIHVKVPGQVAVTVSASGNSEYDPGTTVKILHVVPRPLAITATGPAKVYGEALAAGSSAADFNVEGLVTGETVSSVTLTPDAAGLSAATPAGASYIITPSTAAGSGGFSVDNYTISYVPYSGTVSARPVTVTADAKSKAYGAADPALTYNITSGSLVNGDEFAGELTRDGGDSPGSYAIWQGSLALSDNYSLAYTGANLVITNSAPSALVISRSAINENVPAGSTVGSFTTTDPDPGSTFTYTLVDGTGGNDNAAFTVAGSDLTINAIPDYETKSSYSILVRTTDQDGLFVEQQLTITIANVNEAPADLSPASAAINENVAAGTVITVFGTTDPDSGDTFLYTLVSGDGSDDNTAFTISGNDLTINASPDYETKSSYTVRVRSTDAGGLFTEKIITLTVSDLNDNAPAITSNGGGATAGVSIAENITSVTTVTAIDADAGATLSYSLNGGSDASKFTINSTTGALTFISAPDFENPVDADGNNTYIVIVRASDGTLTVDQTITVTVTNENDNTPVITSNGGGATAGITISENTTSVTTVGATDADAGATLSYSLNGGADADKFSINSTTGVLTFTSAPDFESPADADGNNTYAVVVRASDGTLTADQTITVTVTNENDNAPVITSNGGGGTAGISIAENTTTVTTVTATDADAGATLSYSLNGGADADKFSINSTTGALTFNLAPDFENPADADGNNTYVVIVRASDGALTVDQTITVTVTNENDNTPVITSNGGGATASVTISENTTAVTTVTATDADAGTTLSYSLNGGVDAGKFTINSTTGALVFTSAPDFESPGDADGNNTYVVTVRASDGALTADQAITVTVTNANDNTPVITSNGGGATASVTIEENTTAVTTVTATDADAGATLSYSLDGGADADKFTINSTTGALTFTSAPDFENPADADGNNTYVVVVRASDGTLTVDQTITVTVTNDNDNTPVITSNGGGSTAGISIAENTTTVTTVTATDADAGATLSYSLNGGADADKFSINSATGVLTFTSAPDFENPADADGNNTYVVTVRASDGTLAADQTITVTITNENDNTPVITSNGGGATAGVSIAENTTIVTTVMATDADAGAMLSYSLNGGADAAKFSINGTTGALTFVTAPDFENPADADGNNTYEVTVRASDGTLTVDQTITITVTNENDNTPVITSNGGGATAGVTIEENTTAVTTVTATDADAGTTLSYSLNGGADADKFSINGTTGALTFVTAPDFESPGDADGNNTYVVTVRASDGTLTVDQTIIVTVTNENDNTPIITSNGGGATASVTIEENTTTITTVTATDVDAGATLTYSLNGGADADKFTINSTTGALAFTSAPDFENPGDADGNNTYVVIVRAGDGTLTADQTITVTVTNANDNTPVITSNGGGATAGISIAENTTTITTVTATDADAGATLSYSLNGGADANKFTINGTTGALTFVTAPDFEDPGDADGNNTYVVTVRASDGTLTIDQTITVTVTNENDNTPVITSNGGGATASVTMTENTTAVTTVMATDADAGATLSYSLNGGADADKFSINNTTGVLTFISAPDFENPADADGNNIYVVTVRASDGTLTTEQTITVTVTNVNDNAPVITSHDGEPAVNLQVEENTTAVTTITAVDPDPGAVLTYRIVAGLDGAMFAINNATGELSFATAPDFEHPGDSDGDNTYIVAVEVTDGSFTSNPQRIKIKVSNVNDNAPVITSNGGGSTAAISVEENMTAVATVTATDADKGTVLSYSIAGGADAASFTINSATGLLTFITAPDFETPADADGDNIYTVTVRTSDGTLGAEQEITVTVTNVNDNAPMITSGGGAATTGLNLAENTTAVMTVVATDTDAGTTIDYSITGGADAGRFSIGNATGALTFISAPDFENPADADGNNTYIVMVRASDGSQTAVQTITVTITDLNDNAPVITSGGGASSTTIAVQENTTSAVQVTATDADAGTSIVYSLDGGADAGKFSIDAPTGELRFLTAPDFENPADAAGNNTYIVVIKASDGSLSATQTITVTVTDVNDNAPVITSYNGEMQVGLRMAENMTAAGTVTAADADAGTTITYNIVPGQDAAKFSVNPLTGELSFIAAPDFENPADTDGDNTYIVSVEATDGQLSSAAQRFKIKITDVADSAPRIISNGGGATAAANTEENMMAVLTVMATDPDPGTVITYSIGGGVDAARFTIDASTGLLSFAAAPDFEQPADADGNNTYIVIVRASDGTLTAEQTITVTVTNVNDNTPVITSYNGETPVNLRMAENTTLVARVTAADADADATVTYKIVPGQDGDKFTINSLTGELSFARAPDFEQPADTDGDNVYMVSVEASDGQFTSVAQRFKIKVTDMADSAPGIISNGGGATAAISIEENTMAVLTVMATDADPGTVIAYSIGGGVDAASFTIDASTGLLSFAAAPDFEEPADADHNNTYIVVVKASDGSLFAEQTITVTVTDVNDNAPVITFNGGGVETEISIAENLAQAGTVTATDKDAGSVIIYSITGGADLDKFMIDRATGELTFRAAPDFEQPADADRNNTYIVTVRASDGSLFAEQMITVTVTDVNDNAPVITSFAGETAVSLRLPENSTLVADVTATDADAGTILSYSIVNEMDGPRFAVSSTGELAFINPPDFENPGDTDRDNTYIVAVQVSDGVYTAIQRFKIKVTDMADATSAGRNNAVPEKPAAETGKAAEIKAYPNPATGKRFTLEMTGLEKGKYMVEIYSISSGQLIYRTSVEYTGTRLRQLVLLPPGTASGMYLIQVKGGKPVFMQKLMVD